MQIRKVNCTLWKKKQEQPALKNTQMEILLINRALFSDFATTLSTRPWNTNTHHYISGCAGSAESPLALLTNRYSHNHLPSVLSGLQPVEPSSCLHPPSPLILGAFAARRCFDTLKLLPRDQTSKYLPGQQRATPRQLTMQHLNISRMQSGLYTGEEMGSGRKRRSRAWAGEIMSTGVHKQTSASI